MCNNFFCIDNFSAYNKRCPCSCCDVKRGCPQQFICTYRRPAIQRYICRICIPRTNRATLLQSGATTINCSACGQRTGPATNQIQKPEISEKFDISNACTCAQGVLSQRNHAGCRCNGCCIVLCGR